MSQILPTEEVRRRALERWQQPHPAFTSGRDPRSCENALLVLFYGSLEKAARYDWLNAGRTLVDKTYLRILWTVRTLPCNGLSYDEMASRLDGFIRTELQPRWVQLTSLEDDERHTVALALVEMARGQLFGPSAHAEAASEILFFLCPQLPVFPCRGLGTGDYAAFHQDCRNRLKALPVENTAATPVANYGQEPEQQLINELLAQSDWWPRRLLVEQLCPSEAP